MPIEIDLGVEEFQPNEGLRRKFYLTLNELRNSRATVDAWFLEVRDVLREFGYEMKITKGG